MYIGEASKVSGATIKAIRLYEELGLLPNIVRENSYRVYSEEDILIIKFIKLAQKYDFKLSELKEIIYPKEATISWERIRHEINAKEDDIVNEIIRLQDNKKQLSNYSDEIHKCLLDNEGCLFPNTAK